MIHLSIKTIKVNNFLYKEKYYNLFNYNIFMRVLLLENIHDICGEIFRKEQYEIVHCKQSLEKSKLIEIIKTIDIIGIRSKTNLTEEVLSNAANLKVIGVFCIGTDQVDLNYASQKGITVFNSPYMNTRSVAELAISHIINLARQVNMRNREMHNGIWNKTCNKCMEIREKNLGIIGYGHVGSQLSVLAEAIGMNVYFYDIDNVMALGNSKNCESLDKLLEISDFISVHVPLTNETKNLISKKDFFKMKKGSYLLNLSRGNVVNIEDLKIYIDNGHLGGCAIDVFPSEPKSNGDFSCILKNSRNTILTPHIGGSTGEAQKNIALDLSNKILKFIKEGSTQTCVNYPNIFLNTRYNKSCVKILNIHTNKPGVMSNINEIINNYNYNILGSSLGTDESFGISLISLNGKADNEMLDDILELKNDIQELDSSIITRMI